MKRPCEHIGSLNYGTESVSFPGSATEHLINAVMSTSTSRTYITSGRKTKRKVEGSVEMLSSNTIQNKFMGVVSKTVH